ncbi:MAG: 50S ribosomal protein L9 [Bdellovibrionales bacterium RIFOXYD1_FULL_53_11]|nr:MAG: 50S ribosomal protein L9 [Bdellovibrionales bacterium RIFOXYD1_FULL_53_11]
MLVILRENVDNLGHIGDVVNVSPGYARNFLLPRKLVELADAGSMAQIEHLKTQLAKKRQAHKSAAEDAAKKLSDFSCTIQRKVGENDKLYGSVSVGDIVDVLKKAGFQVQKKDVHVPSPIKALGVHPVTVRLQPEVEATVKVWVVKEE